jgi:dihydroxyacid dehydratase/phosphogluconate dehydratase
MEGGIARSHGTCMTMGTAATMMGIAEAMGLTLPGASQHPGVDANHQRMATECGRRIVDMVWEDLTPQRLLTPPASRTPSPCAMAMGCSTNAIIHLVAMSRRAGHPVSLDDFDAASRKRAGDRQHPAQRRQYLMEDFYYAGGLRALMNRWRACCTWTRSPSPARQPRRQHRRREVYNDDVIRPLDKADLRRRRAGRAARQPGARRRVIKPSACAPRCCSTPARRGVRRLPQPEEGR